MSVQLYLSECVTVCLSLRPIKRTMLKISYHLVYVILQCVPFNEN